MRRQLPLFFSLLLWLRVDAQSPFQPQYDSILFYLDKEEYKMALPICNSILAADSSQMNAWYTKGICEGNLQQYAGAVYCFSKIAHSNPAETGFWVSAAWFALHAAQYDSAVYYGEQALSLAPEDFNNYLNIAHAYYLKNQWHQALYYYYQASEYLPQQPDLLDNVLWDMDVMDSIRKSDLTRAVKEMFIDHFNQVKVNAGSNRVLDSIYMITTGRAGNKAQVLGRLKTAFIKAQEKEELLRYRVLRDFLYDAGWNELVTGNQKGFTQFYLKGLEIDEFLGDSLSLVNYHIRLSKQVLSDQRSRKPDIPDILDAVFFARKSLQFAEKYHHEEGKIVSLFQIGNCFYEGREYDSALYFFLKALPLVKITPEYGVHDYLLLRILTTCMEKDDYPAALKYFTLHQRRAGKVKDPGQRFLDAASNFQAFSYKMKQYEPALRGSLDLLQVARHSGARSNKVSFLLEIAGLCCYKLGKKDSAQLLLQQSVESFIAYARQYRDPDAGKKILLVQEEKSIAFSWLRKIWAENNNPDKLFETMEQSREGLLYYYLGNQVLEKNTANLRACQQKLPANAAAIEYSNFYDINGGIGVGFNQQNRIIVKHDNQQLNSDFENLGMYKKIVRWLNVSEQSKNDPERLAMFLPLVYYQQCSGYHQAVRGLLPDNKAADSSVFSDAAVGSVSKLLYRFYIKPYESLLKDKEVLYISPDAILNFIPFEALMDENGRYLGEKYRIVYVPSFSIKEFLEKKKYNDPGNILAFGNPDYSNYHPEKLDGRAYVFAALGGLKSWTDLPGTEKELKTLNETVPGCRVYQQGALSESVLKNLSKENELMKAGILHFALHGFTNIDGGYQDNSLVISEPENSTEDGLLQFREIVGLKQNPRLTFLSACETGFGFPKADGDGAATSMVTAFLAAGSGSCIGTNWKIADEASMLFVREFYQLVQQKIDFPEALYRVRKKFIAGEFGKRYQSPYYWAPFKYYGF